MGVDSVQHRPGLLKQQNKGHKHGRHKSKGSIDKLNKGRVIQFKRRGKKKVELTREERRHQATQHRQNKRFEYLQKRRGICETPFLVAVVPLHSSINVQETIDVLKGADSEATVINTPEGYCHINVGRLKHRFTLVGCGGDNLFDVLDVLKVAETVVLLVSVQGLDEEASVRLTCALAQGLPTPILLCTDLHTVPPKKRQDCKVELQKEMERWLPDEKVAGLDKNGDGLTVLRRIAHQKQRAVLHRDNRPHLLAEHVHFIETSKGKGTLEVTGYLRGQNLSVNSLVHIPGWGDFRMSQIDLRAVDPFKDPEEQHVRVLEKADPAKQWSLESENTVDPMDAEQTWPTEEEIAEAKEDRKRKVKRRPKGMSDYQAAWIPDVDAVELSDVDEEEDEEGERGMEAESDDEECSEDEEGECEDMETASEASEVPLPPDLYDSKVDHAEEEAALINIREAQEDKEFPDEVDTPVELPARERFLRYRGLSSFRTSPWDPRENLPHDYARIFRFRSFPSTRRHVLAQQRESNGAQAGWYIRVHIEEVPAYLYRYREEQPLVVYGMLEHENKMSVVNVVLKLANTQDTPVKSKESLVLQCGYRRYRAQPIFSQHTKGNKFKYEKFLRHDGTVVATMFAPIIFPPSSVLAFKENKDDTSSLIATGSVLSVDPNRVIVKRVVLSGHPYKVNKRSAVIRFMFYNREDIDWFKPVELHTKYGRRGHIKEPLGTHGHMKCVFNGQLKSQDTVLLNLYKRVFPKWTYDPQITFRRVMEEEESVNK